MRRRPCRSARRPRSSSTPPRPRRGRRAGIPAVQLPRAVTDMAAAMGRRPTRGWPTHRRGRLAPRLLAATTGKRAPEVSGMVAAVAATRHCQCHRHRRRVTCNRRHRAVVGVAGSHPLNPHRPSRRQSRRGALPQAPPLRRPPVQRVTTATESGGQHPPRCPQAAVGGGGTVCARILPPGRGCTPAGGRGWSPTAAAAGGRTEDVAGGDAPPPPPRARNAMGVRDDAWRRPGAGGGASAAPWRGRGPTRRGAATRPATGRRGSARTRRCRHRIRCCQRLPSRGPCRTRLGAARTAPGAAGADGRPWGVYPATDARGDPWEPPAATRGITRCHPCGRHLPSQGGGRTTR